MASFEIDTFRFAYRQNVTFGGTAIEATNGPIVVHFSITDMGLIYAPLGSNVTLSYEHLPAIALAVARWHRTNQRITA